MAYQNVGRPKFYINWLDFIVANYKVLTPTITYVALDGTEEIKEDSELIRIVSLSNRRAYTIIPEYDCSDVKISFNFDDDNLTTKNNLFEELRFLGILGHNLADNDADFSFNIVDSDGDSLSTTFLSLQNSSSGDKDWNGFWIGEGNMNISNSSGKNISEISITIYPNSSEDILEANSKIELSNFILGRPYTMPKSPDLSLTITREYDGIDKTKASGGATLVNYKYIRPPGFGNYGYFERSKIGSPLYLPSRTGRKRWNLGFKYLESTSSSVSDNVFTSQEEMYSSGGNTYANLYERDSFFGRVIHMTEGGSRPFIFLPDHNENDNDQWAVCTFGNNSFDFEQTAPGLYDISLDIVESW